MSEQPTLPSPGPRRDELDLLVTEYNALRAELLDHYASQRTILQLYLAAVGIIAGFAVSGIKQDIVVLVALVSPVFWWLHMNASARIELIDSYLRDVLSTRAQQLGSTWVFRWEDLKTWVWTNFPWRLVLRIGTGLHGNAWTMYLLPSALSLVWTGRDAVSIIFHLSAGTQDQTILFWAWLTSFGFNVLLILREIVSFQTWRINIDCGGSITLEPKPAVFSWYWFPWHWGKDLVRGLKRGS